MCDCCLKLMEAVSKRGWSEVKAGLVQEHHLDRRTRAKADWNNDLKNDLLFFNLSEINPSWVGLGCGGVYDKEGLNL